MGVDQLIDDVIYEIKDNRTLEKLLDIKYISTDEIREFVRDKKLIAFKGEEVTTASIKYKESDKAEIFLIVFFEAWFQQCLLPALTQKSVIILDNARFHRMGVLREMAEKLGHKVFIASCTLFT